MMTEPRIRLVSQKFHYIRYSIDIQCSVMSRYNIVFIIYFSLMPKIFERNIFMLTIRPNKQPRLNTGDTKKYICRFLESLISKIDKYTNLRNMQPHALTISRIPREGF